MANDIGMGIAQGPAVTQAPAQSPAQSTVDTSTTAPAPDTGAATAKPDNDTAGQATSSTTGDQKADPGQGETPPAEAKKDAAKEQAKTPPQPVAWDDKTQNWMKSKGWDPTAFDGSNPHVRSLIDSQRNAEQEITRRAQEEKTRELAEKAKIVTTAGPEAPKTKIEEFDQFHSVILENVLGALGVSDLDALATENPAFVQRLENIYLKGKQEAWIAEQERIKQVAEQDAQRKAEQARFAAENERFNRQAQENLMAIKAKNPDYDKHLTKSGADKVLEYLDSNFTVPKEWILSDPGLAQWFAKAAEAISTISTIDGPGGMKEKWQQDYEKSLRKAQSAALPPATGDMDPLARVGKAFGGQVRHGVNIAK